MIYFLIPTYNEALNIVNLKKALQTLSLKQATHFVFADDGSTDDTPKLIKENFSEYTFEVLSTDQNKGPGDAFNRGFKFILNHSKNPDDLVVTLEADCTSDLSILPHMLALNKMGYTLVLSSVYAQGGGFDQTSFFRKLISTIANLYFRFHFDIKVLTLSSFYRVYDIKLLQKIKAQYGQIIHENDFICKLEVLLKAVKVGSKIIEVPMVLHSKKRVGKSKMKIMKTTWSYLKLLWFSKI